MASDLWNLSSRMSPWSSNSPCLKIYVLSASPQSQTYCVYTSCLKGPSICSPEWETIEHFFSPPSFSPGHIRLVPKSHPFYHPFLTCSSFLSPTAVFLFHVLIMSLRTVVDTGNPTPIHCSLGPFCHRTPKCQLGTKLPCIFPASLADSGTKNQVTDSSYGRDGGPSLLSFNLFRARSHWQHVLTD